MMPQNSPTNILWYEVCVLGHLDSQHLNHLENFHIIHQPDGQSLLRGPLADQAAMYGLLLWLIDLGIPLVSLNPINKDNLYD